MGIRRCGLASDTEIEISGLTGTRSVKVTKQRDHVCGETFGFNLEVVSLGFDDDGDEIKTCVAHDAAAPASTRCEPTGKTSRYARCRAPVVKDM